MVVAFPPEVLRRLESIEATEGVPPTEIVHQAVDVWSQLTADERRVVGIAAMQLIVERLKSGRRIQ